MSDTLPPGATQYFKRALPTEPDALPPFLTRELSIVERAIRDRRLRLQRHTDTDLTLTAQDEIVYVDAAGGNVTITLPDARRFWGFEYTVKRLNAAGGNVLVDASPTTIDGGATATLTLQYESITFASDGTEWWIL